MGGAFMIALGAENRAGSSVAGGDEADVAVDLDTAPREASVPADLNDALNQDLDARRFFDDLSYGKRLRHPLAIEEAKTPATRQRRVAGVLGMFRTSRV